MHLLDFLMHPLTITAILMLASQFVLSFFKSRESKFKSRKFYKWIMYLPVLIVVGGVIWLVESQKFSPQTVKITFILLSACITIAGVLELLDNFIDYFIKKKGSKEQGAGS